MTGVAIRRSLWIHDVARYSRGTVDTARARGKTRAASPDTRFGVGLSTWRVWPLGKESSQGPAVATAAAVVAVAVDVALMYHRC